MSTALAYTIRYGLTFTAGFLTRPCCVIPAVVSIAGVGGAGIAAALVPWRPWFVLLAAILFAISFHWNFIRNRSKPGMVVWCVSAMIAGFLLLAPTFADSQHALDPTQEVSTVQTVKITIDVEGMMCTACSRRLQAVLSGVEGVQRALVSYEDKSASVEYDPNQIDRQAIHASIRDTGFTSKDTDESQ